MEAVTSTIPTAAMPPIACHRRPEERVQISCPYWRRVRRTPKAKPKAEDERNILLMRIGWSTPVPGLDWMPVMMANGIATKPKANAKCATWSTKLRCRPMLSHPWLASPANRKARPAMAKAPTANSVETTCRVPAETISAPPPTKRHHLSLPRAGAHFGLEAT